MFLNKCKVLCIQNETFGFFFILGTNCEMKVTSIWKGKKNQNVFGFHLYVLGFFKIQIFLQSKQVTDIDSTLKIGFD